MLRMTVSAALGMVLLLAHYSITLAGLPAGRGDNLVMEYSIGWQQPNSHLFTISLRTATAGAASLDFALPNWRPGRYQIQNYARNVQDFTAVDESGRPLDWVKLDKSTWRVSTARATTVEVRYRYYANLLDAGSSLLNDQEAYFNGTNLFMYIPERRAVACRLKLLSPPEWPVATALARAQDGQFVAANYDELVDSPVITSPTLTIYQFRQDQATYYLAFQGKVEHDIKQLAEQIGKLIAEQVKLFGGAPYDRYWVLCHLTPGGRWHGVEHAYSTSLTAPQSALSSESGRQNFYSLVSHEFFHLWNVKRITPQAFMPIDYSRESYTRLLWFFEGVTSYYGDLLLKRAGIYSETAFLYELEKVISELQNTPGRELMSAEEASFNGWLQPDDRDNAQLSFYTKGMVLGLMLDLEIRRRTEHTRSLDDVMRYLYEHYGKRNLGVPEEGIRAAVEAVSDSNFQDFFARYIAGRDELPYNQLLPLVALHLTEEADKNRPEAFLGVKLSGDDRPVITNVLPGSPAMAAGLDRDDQLLAINGAQVTITNFSELLSLYKPGDKINVALFRERKLRNFEVTLSGGGNITFKLKRVEKPLESQQRALAGWLGNNGKK